PSVEFPRLNVTMGRSDSLPPISPHFVSFAWRYRRFVPCSSPPARDGSCGSTWSWSAGTPTGSHDGNDRVSQVPERPSCPYALFQDPGRTDTRQAIAASRRGPRLIKQRWLPQEGCFRGSIARHWDSLSTLRREGHPSTTQDSLPDTGQVLPGGSR